MPLMRIYYKRFSLRIGMTLSLLIAAASFIQLYWARGPILMYIAATTMGLSFASGTTLSITLLLHNWFTSHISIAFGLITAGSGLASLIGSPLIVGSIHKAGLSLTFMFEGFFIIICVAVFFIVARERPKGAAAVQKESNSENQPNCGKTRIKRDKTYKKNLSRNLIIFVMASFLVGTFSSICITSYPYILQLQAIRLRLLQPLCQFMDSP